MTKQRVIPKPAVVLRLLLEGAIIEYSHCFWVMGEGGRMGCAAVDDNGDMIPPNEEGNITILYVLDDALENFVQWAESLPDEVIFSAACNLVLREINKAGESYCMVGNKKLNLCARCSCEDVVVNMCSFLSLHSAWLLCKSCSKRYDQLKSVMAVKFQAFLRQE